MGVLTEFRIWLHLHICESKRPIKLIWSGDHHSCCSVPCADYGNRVGAWRLLDLFAEFKVPCAMLLNSQLYHHCPELMAYGDSLGHEVVAHSRTNTEWQVIALPCTLIAGPARTGHSILRAC